MACVGIFPLWLGVVGRVADGPGNSYNFGVFSGEERTPGSSLKPPPAHRV